MLLGENVWESYITVPHQNVEIVFNVLSCETSGEVVLLGGSGSSFRLEIKQKPCS